MQSLILLVLFCISFAVSANPLKGTWEYVRGEYATPDGRVTAESPSVTSTNIISDTHFSYITLHSGKFAYAGGGTFLIKKNRFIETIKYGNLPEYIGRTMSFTYEIKGDLWYHTLYEDGKFVEKEVWKKVVSKL